MSSKAVLITGAAKRVGRELALNFARSGYDVALHYHRSKADAQIAADHIENLGGTCELIEADLTDAQARTMLIAKAYSAFPHLSVLVNNASVFDPGKFTESSMALYEKQFAINTTAPIFLTQAFAKVVKKGAVINMLDTKITDNKHSYFFYLLSKKTLAEFTTMAAVELGPNLRVNAVAPGHVLPSQGWGEDYQQRLEAMLPLKRIARLDEVAQAVYSLAENTGITGQVIYVDGGEHLL